jgi:hypothetical protein
VLIVRYFIWVGSALLVLLFIADSRLPRVEARDEPERNYNIRLEASVDGPEAVTFSGHAVAHAPAPALEVVDFARRAADEEKAADARAAETHRAYAKVSATEVAQTAAKAAPQRSRRQHVRRRHDPDAERARYVEAREWWWPRF